MGGKKLEFADVIGYPIMEVGTWNGMEFTEEDLDKIARAAEELADVQRVPLKLGHNEEQPMLDGAPAFGWIKNLRRVGRQLVADFEHVPKILKEAIAKKMYRAVSVELLLGAKHGDKKYERLLDAVAILGATPPAVRTLPDLDAYLASRSVDLDDCGRRVVFEVRAGNAGESEGALVEAREFAEREALRLCVAAEIDRALWY